jgi:exopolyphosphatase/guanosine-5'-triphosphate,3'-diphosphate pyrophosphatase
MSPPLAAIDIGTNTVRLLIARPRLDGGLERLTDRAVTVRLGQGVDASGRLAPDRMERAAAAVAELAAEARAAGVAAIPVLATSAVRDAANRAELLALVRERAGLDVDVIDGEREAQLTFRGALLGRPMAGRRLVVDIGGGSTEVIAARDGEIVAARSLQIGSGRLTERCLPTDPPTADEVQTARQMAAALVSELESAPAEAAVWVGGTGSTALRLTRREPADDRVTRAMLRALLADLLAVPAATFAADGRVEPERARILPGGIIIMEALMDRFRLDEASVSQGGIREGALLELLERSGDGGV